MLIVLVAFLAIWNTRPKPVQLEDLRYEPQTQSVGGLTIQFLGNTNILFDDGTHRILTDGFFSRPSAAKVLLGKIEPDRQRITNDLERAGIHTLSAVIPLHSHFDHAMDAPIVAEMTQAQLIGSASTLMIGRGLGFPEDAMSLAPLDSVLAIGKFRIRFISSSHWQYPSKKQRKLLLDQSITTPIVPPVPMHAYKEGVSYTLLIEHENLSIAIQGSAGFKAGSIPEFDADILFLAIAGLEMMDETYNENYQEYVIDAVDPEVIVPIHWDDFTLPLSRGLKTTNLAFNLKFKANLGKAFSIVEQNNPNRKIRLLDLWERIDVHALVHEPM